jgi:hypothetical protein
MTHEPIRVIHFSPHITWQGTQAELDAMLAEGWPMGSASEIIAACNRDAAEAKAYAEGLEAKLAKAVELVEEAYSEGFAEGYDGGWIGGDYRKPWKKSALFNTLAELKGDKP